MARDELVLSDYLRVVLRHKWYVILTTLITLGFTHYYSGREQPVFESRTRIKIQRLVTVAGLFDELLVSSGDPIENYLYEITSYVVISNAAAALRNPSAATPAEVANLQASVRATKVEHTDLIDIFAVGNSPAAALQRVQAVVAAFIRHHDQSLTENAQEVYDTIKNSRDTLMNGLKEQEEALWKKYGARMITGDSAGEMTLLKERLIALEIRLQDLRATGNYTEEYPEIKSIKAQMAEISGRIDRIMESELARQTSLKDYENYKAISEEMGLFFTRRLEEAKIAAQKRSETVQVIEPGADGRPIQQSRTRTLLAGALLGLMLGLVLAFVADSLDTSLRTLMDIEAAFGLPVLTVVPHFSPDAIDVPLHPEGWVDRIRYSRIVTTMAMVWKALFGLFARRSRRAGQRLPELIVPFGPRAPATEAYRMLRTNLLLAMNKSGAKTFLVTSAGPGEGKSTTITNTAVVFAQAGKKTLLVGANMRRPKMDRIFGLERERGLANILAGEITWREALKDFRDVALGERAGEGLASAPGMDNLFFISTGGRTNQPAEWLSLPEFEALLKEWKEQFDVILIDAPPLLPVPDSVIISKVVDAVIVVYQVGVAARESMRRALSLLHTSGANVMGIVLNDIRSSWAEDANLQHYRGYYGRPGRK